MKTRIIIVLAIFFALTLTYCKVDEKRTIDIALLKSDWLNAKYNYFFYFNDSTVLNPPDENATFVYDYLVRHDTLSICRMKGSKYKNWEKFQILLLSNDALTLKNITKRNFRLKSDTITFANTSTINKSEAKIKSIEFNFVGRPHRTNFELKNDTLKFYELDKSARTPYLSYKLDSSIIKHLNLKMKLVEPNCTFDLGEVYVGRPAVNMKIELEEKYGRTNTIIIKGDPPNPEENLRLASFIVYLVSLEEIVRRNESKK